MTTSPRQLDLTRIRLLVDRSVEIITEHQADNGAYPASPTFSAYAGYAWLRDGGFTAEGMSRHGAVDSVDRFHDWVCRVLASRTDQVATLVARHEAGQDISPADMLPTRFTLDGSDGSDPWWDFQTDGYGTWVWAVVTHARRHGLDLDRWREGIEVAVDFVAAFWHQPCYDWWEEHVEQRHTSSLGAIVGGLEAALSSGVLDTDRASRARVAADGARALALTEGVVDGHLTKWLGSDAVDGSLPACVVPFGLVAPGGDIASRTLGEVADQLDVDGGVHRFGADVFYGGGQWLLLSAFLGWNLAATGDRDGAMRHLQWIVDHTLDNGEMPEQVDDHLLHPESREEWLSRWGPVATPLLWSHGMYLVLTHELGLDGDAA